MKKGIRTDNEQVSKKNKEVRIKLEVLLISTALFKF